VDPVRPSPDDNNPRGLQLTLSPSLPQISLQALVAKRDWSEIEEISKTRKSPIGWEVSPPLPVPLQHSHSDIAQPFFNQTLQAGNPRLAAAFVPKCTGLEPATIMAMYEKCGMRVKAAEEAVRVKDAEAWAKLLEAAGRNTQEGREIERLGLAVFRK